MISVPTFVKLLRYSRFDIDSKCWMWTHAVSGKGYGQVKHNGTMKQAHRVSYETFVGSIPADMDIDHLCRNRACINPTHLEVVSHRENLMRGEGFAAANVHKTHCINGHELSENNLVKWYAKRGWRRCLICYRQQLSACKRRYRRERRERG